jgi:hypothetical protein
MKKKDVRDLSVLDRFCYLKIQKEEIEAELEELQKEILSWPDRPEKIQVDPYGILSFRSRENWKVMDISGVFSKIGKDSFLGICSVPVGKLKKVVGDIGFGKLEKLGMVEKGENTEYYNLKRNSVFKGYPHMNGK